MITINRDLSALYPPFAADVSKFISAWNLNHPDTPVQIFEGFRSYGRQGELYAQGRTSPGHIVTNAPEGMSFHCYGIAVDLVFDADPVKPGIQWTWDGKMPWDKLSAMSISMGFESAGTWRTFKEWPHFQKTYGMQITEALEIARISGVNGVWEKLAQT